MIGASSDGSGAYQYTWRTSTGDVPALRAIAFAALDLCHAHPGQAKQDWASKTLDNTASAAQKLGAPSGHPFSASMPLSQPDNLASMWMLSQTDLASVMFWVAYVRAWLQVRYLQAKNIDIPHAMPDTCLSSCQPHVICMPVAGDPAQEA